MNRTQMKDQVKTAFARAGLAIGNHRASQEQRRRATVCGGLVEMLGSFGPAPVDAILALPKLERKFIEFCLVHWSSSHSQLRQDLFVRWVLDDLRGGRFVEFGAGDGVLNSNTKALEDEFAWKGLLLEPELSQFRELKRNRSKSIIVNAAVSPDGAKVGRLVRAGQLSSLSGYADGDLHAKSRKEAKSINVALVNLNQVITDVGLADAPIDYMSVDTEGGEYQILRGLEFSRFQVKVFSVENNGREPDRTNLLNLMEANGYTRTFDGRLTGVDDWYVRQDIWARVQSRWAF